MIKRIVVLIITIFILTVSIGMLNYTPAQPIGSDIFEQDIIDLMDVFYTAIPEQPEPESEEEILELFFSHTKHFYTSDIEVAITASNPDAIIYYTTDGSEPTAESSVYSEPLPFVVSPTPLMMGVYPLKAIAVLGDEVTRPLVHTYFVDNDINVRFDVMVISLSTDHDYLYDYETGIMVEGITRAEYKAENPWAHIDPPAPANFNWRGRESERPMYVEMFEPDGKRVIAQAAGVRVHGGWSRAASQKSLRLIARDEYEPGEGRFSYDFFPDDVRADGFDTPIVSYDQLILSNNANDREFGMMRQEVNYALARQAGIRTVSPFRAAAVFLNGSYYGFTWMQVSINEQMLEHIYSAPTKEFQIVGNGEEWIASEDFDDIDAIEHLNSFYYKDFTDDEVFAEFESLVDIDNLLLYYAYQTYAGNRDWPNNNFKRWRYTGPTREGLAERGITDEDEIEQILTFDGFAPELDGRWRYIMFDMDFLMSLYEGSIRANSPSFTDYVRRGNERYSYMLAALFVRPEIVDRYAMIICDLAANVLTAENVEEQINKLYDEAYNEIGEAIRARKFSSWVGYGSIEDNHRNMIGYTEQRAGHFLKGMRDYFGWDDKMFKVEVSGASAYIGSQVAESSEYFGHLTIPLRPDLSYFEVFECWILNGEAIYTPEIYVSMADAADGVVKAELVTRFETPAFQITQAYRYSDRNGAVLANNTDERQSTAGLYLTDTLMNRKLWQIPQATLDRGGYLQFAGRSSRHASDIHKIQMGFNVRSGRMLYLCNEDGDVISWMEVTS